MRKYLGVGVAVVILAVTMIVWAKPSGVTNSDFRSTASVSPHDIMSRRKIFRFNRSTICTDRSRIVGRLVV
jgi:IS1 family transposase